MSEDQKMTFQALKQTNRKLFQNPNLSEHNKQVLEDFFRKARAGGVGKATLRDYSSRFNKLADHIDFQLDNPSQEDLELLTSKFNQDEIRKNNGEAYSDYSKNKFWKTLSRFYQSFIKRKGTGYNEDIDGPDLVEDLSIKVELSTEVNPDSLPTPSEVKEVVKHANSLRDKTIILIGWSTGARIGEIFKTQYDKNVLAWNDITFEEDKAWITLDGKTGEREIPVKTGVALLRRLYEDNQPEKKDPVFTKKNQVYYCPECKSETTALNRATLERRRYSCQNCSWKGKNSEVIKKVDPLTDNAVRRILERTIERAGMTEEFKTNPHAFFRKSRAMYKVRIGYTEHQLRGFFGWSETSDAPKHYISTVKEDLEKALAVEFGEEVEYDNGYDEEALRPVECVKCGTVNSPVNDLCNECGHALTDQGQEMTQDKGLQGISENVSELAERKGVPPEELVQMMEEKSMMELIENLMD